MDWYPWGDEALARAKADDKPIFLSVGYAACHWCHVMEHESFEDDETAEYLNQHFVSIKVDREERPDVDQIYMNAVTALNRPGRLADEHVPDIRRQAVSRRHLLPGRTPLHAADVRQVLEGVVSAWHDKRDELLTSAQRLVDAIARDDQMGTGGAAPDAHALQQATPSFW